MIVLTRRACSSASSLARSVERRLALLDSGDTDTQLLLPLGPGVVADEEPGAEIGAPGLEDASAERRLLEGILSLALQASRESKLHALQRLLRRSKEPAIVFTEYRDTLATLARELSGFDTCQLHGGLSGNERAEVLRRFSAGGKHVLLATDAASEGLNLQQHCRRVVHLEVPWTPTRIEQRVGRVDRIGQTRTVHQLHLVAAGSLEESHVAAVARRAVRATSVLEAISSHSLTERDVAAHVIGDQPLSAEPPRAGLPSGIVVADLRERAQAEAARLEMARRLMRGVRPKAEASCDAPVQAAQVRPFATAVRRSPLGRMQCVLWLEYIDAEGELTWATLVGAECIAPPIGSRSASAVRECVEHWWPYLRSAVTRHDAFRAEALAVLLRAHLPSAVAREGAIARGVETRQARLAADFVQPSLFDRRAERQANAQRELCNQALARCRVRLTELQRGQSVTAAAIRPAFAILTW